MTSSNVPELTSASGLLDYPPGQKVAVAQGPAWQDVHLSVFSLTALSERFDMPAVTEPFIAWVSGGEAETQEREVGGPWINCRVKPGSLYLTMSSAPYEFRWTRLSQDPLEIVLLLLDHSIFDAALQELRGDDAADWRFQNVSGVEDDALLALLKMLRAEMDGGEASAMYVRAIGQAIAVHLVRRYTQNDGSPRGSSSLPAHKLRLVKAWIEEHLAEPFSLAMVAELVGISEFHFNRLFKTAVGMPPSRYQIKLRIEAAQRLLRESDLSVVAVANEVGYANPSHFAQLFRKETGLTPSEYRRPS